MSAFEVGTVHINVMVSAALAATQFREPMRWYFGDMPATEPGEMLPDASPSDYERCRREVTSENAEQWGAVLLAENRASVNHRYDEDEIEAPYALTEYSGQVDPVAVLSAIACYEYQSCEHPGWKRSEARAFCEALRNKMVRMVPGYDAAPWEITDPSQAFRGVVQVRRGIRR
jgi:hypothetical protein